MSKIFYLRSEVFSGEAVRYSSRTSSLLVISILVHNHVIVVWRTIASFYRYLNLESSSPIYLLVVI
jgi:hypothetical protein